MTDIPIQLPPGKQPTLRVSTMPKDTNPSGNIFGGWIMAQVDIAGGVVAAHRAEGRVVTVSVNSFQFHEPVFVGDVVSFYTDIIKVGRTSVTVFVEVYCERRVAGARKTAKVTEATLTYVAVGPDDRPRPLPAA